MKSPEKDELPQEDELLEQMNCQDEQLEQMNY